MNIKQFIRQRWKLILLGGISAVVLGIIFFAVSSVDRSLKTNNLSIRDALLLETAKYSIQLIFVVILGSVGVGEYNRIRQKKADKKQFRLEVHKKLVAAYLNTKRIRWALKSNCKDNTIDFSEYRNEIFKILEVKAALEILQYEIAAYKTAFDDEQRSEILKNLERMEKILTSISNEYRGLATHENKERQLTSLSDFLGIPKLPENEKSKFTGQFKEPFQDTLKLIISREVDENETGG